MAVAMYAPACFVAVAGRLHVMYVPVTRAVYDDYMFAKDIVITVSRMIVDGGTMTTVDEYIKTALSERNDDQSLRALLAGFGLHLGSGRVYGSKAALCHAIAVGLEGRVPLSFLKHYPHARVFCTRI